MSNWTKFQAEKTLQLTQPYLKREEREMRPTDQPKFINKKIHVSDHQLLQVLAREKSTFLNTPIFNVKIPHKGRSEYGHNGEIRGVTNKFRKHQNFFNNNKNSTNNKFELNNSILGNKENLEPNISKDTSASFSSSQNKGKNIKGNSEKVF